MNEKSLKVLEWPKVRQLVAERTSFSLSRQLAAELQPTADLDLVVQQLALTSAAVGILERHGEAPFGGAADLRQALNKARLQGLLEPDQLLPIADFLYCVAQLKKYFGGEVGRLAELAGSLVSLAPLRNEIERCLDHEGFVKDSASPELAKIRIRMRTLANRIRDRLDALIRSSNMQKILQDPIVTVRNGRYVVPVRSEYRTKFSGIVHDQSGSGATLFMEPAFAVELNNDLSVASQEEQAELQRILRRLSGLVYADAEVISTNLDTVAELDLIFARARYSRAIDGVEPAMNDSGQINIKQGQHPLLSGEVVPIDIWLGQEFNVLVITGPNTGGKTVTLKTVGLFCLMAQAGLHIPADAGSSLAVFKGIYADIGDEQSIEQSLSTFSSHMTTIVDILRGPLENSLVLLDELGAGTDPTEGAALATSILEHLRLFGHRTIATTHYSDLKSYAYTQQGVENASVEFDLKTLRPTYRLAIGIPGKSNAFAISRRLGLAPEIVEQAEAMLSTEHLQVEEMISEMELNRRLAEQARGDAQRFHSEQAELKRKYERLVAELEEQRAAFIEHAHAEAREQLEKTQAELNEILGAARRMDRVELEGKIGEFRRQLGERAEKLTPRPRRRTPGPLDLKVGEEVRIKSLRQKGFVLERPSPSGEVQIQAGIMKITVKAEDLERVQSPASQAKQQRSTARAHLAKSSSIRGEIDLRGNTVDEGLAAVDKYLDDAFLSALARVTIIHGKGTGVLREAIQKHLEMHPHVQAFRLGAPTEGGLGVTVVDLHNPS